MKNINQRRDLGHFSNILYGYRNQIDYYNMQENIGNIAFGSSVEYIKYNCTPSNKENPLYKINPLGLTYSERLLYDRESKYYKYIVLEYKL